jgi:adenosylcobinamide kinase / adenosylcobinamide-phosphate guanylyltransferase
MALTLLLGGARSGKSALAVRTASSWAGDVVFVATGTAGDTEMAERIRRHRAARPPAWTTVEEPLELLELLRRMRADRFVLVDCLSLWVANLLEAGWDDERVEREAEAVAREAAAREAPTVIVSNEVGLGIVPRTSLGRRYRDVLGRVNAVVAEAADESLLVVAGRTLPLQSWS